MTLLPDPEYDRSGTVPIQIVTPESVVQEAVRASEEVREPKVVKLERCALCKTRPGTITDIPQPMADKPRLLCVLCSELVADRRRKAADIFGEEEE